MRKAMFLLAALAALLALSAEARSDRDADMGERHNLKDRRPEIAAELTAAAQAWRGKIEARWEREWLPRAQGTTAHAAPAGPA